MIHQVVASISNSTSYQITLALVITISSSGSSSSSSVVNCGHLKYFQFLWSVEMIIL